MRKKIVAANWKMNLNLQEGESLVNDILKDLPELKENNVVAIAPPYLNIQQTALQIKDTKNVQVAAQNCHTETNGAYTGEIAAHMLKAAGVTYVIIGHSERREYNHEDDNMLAKKTQKALEAGLKVIFCCGESLSIRDAGTQNDFVGNQLKAGLFTLDAEQMKNIVIAYEPIWAIGTGRTASSEQAQDMHKYIRSIIAEQYGEETANDMSILYGGSCKPDNANELFACPDVDGGLIGGASLKAKDFLAIINAITTA